jgi:hypothetical protein
MKEVGNMVNSDAGKSLEGTESCFGSMKNGGDEDDGT